MDARVGSIYIRFPKTVRISEVEVIDHQSDTLLYCESIAIRASLLPLIRRKLHVERLRLRGLSSRVYRNQEDSSFNFQPITNLFAKPKPEAEKKQKSDWDIDFGKLELEDIRLSYDDKQDSTFASLILERFSIKSNVSDIVGQQFDLEDLIIAGLQIDLQLGNKPVKEEASENEASPPSALPQLHVRNIELEEIAINLATGAGSFQLNASLGEAKLTPRELKLDSYSIALEDLIATNIDTRIRIKGNESNPQTSAAADVTTADRTESASTFGEFPWTIQLDHTSIADVNVKLDLDDSARSLEGMDYHHMVYQNFSVYASNLYFGKDRAAVNISQFKVSEVAGTKIASLSGDFEMDNRKISAKQIAMQTANSKVEGDLRISYPGLKNIGKQIEDLGIETRLAAVIDLSEMDPYTSFRFDFPDIQQIRTIQIDEFATSGKLSDFQLEKARVRLGDSTHLQLSAHVRGLPSTDIVASFQLDTLYSNHDDLVMLLPDSLIPASIQLPPSIAISGSGTADKQNANAEISLASTFGKAAIYFQKENNELKSSTSANQVDIGELLNQEMLGKTSFNTNIQASLVDNALHRIEAEIDLNQIEFNDYQYKNSAINVLWEDEELVLAVDVKDEFLNANLDGSLRSDPHANHVTFKLHIENAELKQLNLVEEYFKMQGHASVDLDITSKDEFKGLIQITDTDLAMEDRSFHIDEIRFDSDINTSYTNFLLTSEILDAELTGNTKLTELKDALVDHLDLFISLPDSIINQKDFVFEFNLDLKEPDVLTEFFVQDLQHVELEKCHAKYNDAADLLEVEIVVPVLDYNGYRFHNLDFEIESEKDWANAFTKFDSLRFGSYTLNNFLLTSDFEPNRADIQLSIKDINEDLKYQLAAQLDYLDSAYKVVIDEKNTIINYQHWTLPSENYLLFQNGDFYAKGTQLQNGDQLIALDANKNDIILSYQNLLIDNFLNIVEYDSTLHLISGSINGKLEVVDPFAALSLDATLNIDQLGFQDELIGDFTSEIRYGNNFPFEIDASLKNATNYLHLDATSSTKGDQRLTSMILESDISDASSFQPLFAQHINNLKGGIKGRISLSDNKNSRSVNGNMDFDHLDLTIIPTNTRLDFDGSFNIDENLLGFDSFYITDSLQNRLNVDGQVNFSNQNNPRYNLTLRSDEFLLINSPASIVHDLSGKLRLGIDVNIQGPQSNLGVTSNFSIREGTNLMYVMPGRELELITDEGIVQFVDFENEEWEQQVENESMFIGDSIVSLIKGINLDASVTLDPNAQFTVFIDPNSGDLTQFRLRGKLSYKYNDAQKGNLNGLIEFVDGHYELSFYGLVKKRFVYDPGSSVSWGGEVFDGDVNFSARHTVRTNSVGLVSNEISSAEVPIYNQRLPYDVILDVTDKISAPMINFRIDLPQRHRANYPTIDSKLNILNQPAMESERNKQVFALLVGGTFIPENPSVVESSSGSNFATSAARNSVNAIMTQQLNKLTGQFIKGIDIDMGVSSFDEFDKEGAQVQTQLDVKVSKNLFNDRVSAEVESHINLDGSVQEMGQSTAGMTEFAVSYKLTEQGNYRIKAFRENAFDIFDGEIQNSGIAFIFVREFDSFRDWKRPRKKTVDISSTEEEDDKR